MDERPVLSFDNYKYTHQFSMPCSCAFKLSDLYIIYIIIIIMFLILHAGRRSLFKFLVKLVKECEKH